MFKSILKLFEELDSSLTSVARKPLGGGGKNCCVLISVEENERKKAEIILNSYGFQNCGKIPSPAIAFYGLQKNIPTIMVTASHNPADQNGIKFTTSYGEITKQDEIDIRSQKITIPNIFNADGSLKSNFTLPVINEEARELYINRYLSVFSKDLLLGKKLGVYGQSTVIRDIFVDVYEGLGAEVVKLDWSDDFVSIDTEAIRQEDKDLALRWSMDYKFDAILSADGDGDRPLISDEEGVWLRGDVAGILVAKFLGCDAVATPISCNTAVDKSGFFKKVIRTKIGSPYVIAGMETAKTQGFKSVAVYEANGGFLLASDISINDKTFVALPTRDAITVHLAILILSIQKNSTISKLAAQLPPRYTASDRLVYPRKEANKIIAELSQNITDSRIKGIEIVVRGKVEATDLTDGLRMTFSNGEIVHLRASGNADDFRCYVESDDNDRADFLAKFVIDLMKGW